MSDNILPEEKLLRLIRGQKKQVAVTQKSAPPDNNAAVSGPEQKFEYRLHSAVQRCLSLSYIRKIAFWLLGISCIYLVLSFVYPWFGLKKIKLPNLAEEKTAEVEIMPETQVKPFDFYLEAVKTRKIFATRSSGQAEKPVTSVSADLIKNISLVGIIAGDNPQAIVQDKKTQATYYVTKGQFIGEFQVEDIQEGKIILFYNNQRYELYL